MPDVEERLGKVIAAVFRVGRTLDEGALDGLLENIATEIAAAMMEHEAHQRSGRETAAVSRPRTGNVLQFEPRGGRIR